MKKSYLIIIFSLVLIICALLAYIFLFPDKSAEKTDDNASDVQGNENHTSDASIQENQGDLVIEIPDDQESAGE